MSALSTYLEALEASREAQRAVTAAAAEVRASAVSSGRAGEVLSVLMGAGAPTGLVASVARDAGLPTVTRDGLAAYTVRDAVAVMALARSGYAGRVAVYAGSQVRELVLCPDDAVPCVRMLMWDDGAREGVLVAPSPAPDGHSFADLVSVALSVSVPGFEDVEVCDGC